MLYEALRYNIKGRQCLSAQSKYYTVDIGFRNILFIGKEADHGHILENMVYLEPIRRGYETYVGQLGNGEVDFVTLAPEGMMYLKPLPMCLMKKSLKESFHHSGKSTTTTPNTC